AVDPRARVRRRPARLDRRRARARGVRRAARRREGAGLGRDRDVCSVGRIAGGPAKRVRLNVMLGSRLSTARALLLAALCVAVLASASPSAAAAGDDTAGLQSQLDSGGNVFIPKLPNGECYRTRGLWVSRDDTSITSDGACIVGLGPGEARAQGANGKGVRATAVFFLTHSDVLKPLPVRVTISGMR